MNRRNFIRVTARAALIAASAALGCCSALSPRTEPAIANLPALTSGESPLFVRDSGTPDLYQAVNGPARLTAISECGPQSRTDPLARTRQLFVGFKQVRLPESTSLSVDGTPVRRTEILAVLDDVPLATAAYSIQVKDCFYDLVLWIPGVSEDGGQEQQLAASERQLETLLPAVLRQLNGGS